MKEIFESKKSIGVILLIYSVVFLLIFLFFRYEYKKNMFNYLNSFYVLKEQNYKKELNFLAQYTDIIKVLLINDKILQIVAEGNQNINSARKELIKELLPKYKLLAKNGVYLLHFHLLNGISFVRFHDLKRYGDKLYPFRPSIKYVQTTLKPFHGFETGKVVSGFRNVYPLIYKGKLVGSMEISFSMTKFIEKLFDNEYIAYLIKKDVLQKKAFKNILE